MKSKKFTRDSSSMVDNCYNPDETLVKLLQEWLQLHQKKKALAEKGISLSEEDEEEIRLLSRRKVHVLRSILFPSMANLIYFFEALDASNMLSKAFHEEVEELLDARYSKEAAKTSASDMRLSGFQFKDNNLSRLMIAILSIPYDEKNPKAPITDFRLGLMYQLQLVLGDSMDRILEHEFGFSQVLKSAFEDYTRMKGWLALLARSAEIPDKEHNRIMGFCPYWWSKKATTKSLKF